MRITASKSLHFTSRMTALFTALSQAEPLAPPPPNPDYKEDLGPVGGASVSGLIDCVLDRLRLVTGCEAVADAAVGDGMLCRMAAGGMLR